MDLLPEPNLDGFAFLSSEKTVLGFFEKMSCPLNFNGICRNHHPPSRIYLGNRVHNSIYECGDLNTRSRGGIMSNFGRFRGDARIWAVRRVLYCIPFKYRVFLATQINAKAVIPYGTQSKNYPKSGGQGCRFEPLLQVTGAGSPSSDNIFDQGKFLHSFSRSILQGFQVQKHWAPLISEHRRKQKIAPPLDWVLRSPPSFYEFILLWFVAPSDL